jgi:hypothetical protein
MIFVCMYVDYDTSPATHAVEDEDGSVTYQRYCHVYRQGELEDICSRYTIEYYCHILLVNVNIIHNLLVLG